VVFQDLATKKVNVHRPKDWASLFTFVQLENHSTNLRRGKEFKLMWKEVWFYALEEPGSLVATIFVYGPTSGGGWRGHCPSHFSLYGG
jgi:hypothetical protein